MWFSPRRIPRTLVSASHKLFRNLAGFYAAELETREGWEKNVNLQLHRSISRKRYELAPKLL